MRDLTFFLLATVLLVPVAAADEPEGPSANTQQQQQDPDQDSMCRVVDPYGNPDPDNCFFGMLHNTLDRYLPHYSVVRNHLPLP